MSDSRSDNDVLNTETSVLNIIHIFVVTLKYIQFIVLAVIFFTAFSSFKPTKRKNPLRLSVLAENETGLKNEQ